MKIQNFKLEDIHPYERNPRINEGAVDFLVKSIQTYGFINPIIVDKDHVIVAGHTRLLAAQRLGLDTAPVIVATHLTPEQARAYRVADNKSAELAEWNLQLLRDELLAIQEDGTDMGALGFDMGELEELMRGDDPVTAGETDPNDAPAAPEVAESRPGEVYQLGPHRLLCGDSTKEADVAKLMGDDLAALWLTDPPYNVDYHGSDGKTIQNDSMEDAAFRDFLKRAFECAKAHMAAGAPFYITADLGHMNGQQYFPRPDAESVEAAILRAREGTPPRRLWLGSVAAHDLYKRAAAGELGVSAAVKAILADVAAHPHLFAEPADASNDAWVRRVGCYSPIIHLQQTDGKSSPHWTFTPEHNKDGIVKPDAFLKALKAAYLLPDDPAMPPKCGEITLTFEPFIATAGNTFDLLDDIAESVRCWRRWIPKDGVRLHEIEL